MRATTSTYKQLIASNNTRNYLVKINMTLADDTELELTNEDIWSDSFELETASSNTASFDVGCAVIGKCKFQLNNFDERFNSYDFFNATAVVWLKLDGDSSYYRIGFFTVDEPSFAGALISLELLDNMWKFDVPLSEVNLTYPVTILSAVNSICTYCGVTLATQDFHGKNFQIGEPKDDMNCREFLQYVAMIGCNFCLMDSQGNLNIKWYNTSAIPSESDLDGGTFNTNTTPYSDGDTADGGNFLDYTSGDSYDGGTFTDNPDVAYFTRNYSTTLGTDVITITGLKVTIDKTEYTIGSEGYVLEIDNPLITVDNVSSVLNLMWEVLEDFSFRTFSVDALSDLAVEVGDCCAIMDLHGNYAYSFVTNLSYKLTSMTASLGAVSPTRTLTKRYSKTVQQAVDQARKQTDAIITDYDLSVQMMNALSVISMGAYRDYEDVQTGGRIYYLSNMPITKTGGTCSFEPNSTVFKIGGDGFFISTQGGQTGTWNNGYDPITGKLVVNVLNAIGLSCDWIKTGTLTVGGIGTDNPVIIVKDDGGYEIARIDKTGITMSRGVIQGANGYNFIDLNNDDLRLASSSQIFDKDSDYSGNYIPTNNNAPASSWTTQELKQAHVGSTFIYTNTNTGEKTPYVYYKYYGYESNHPLNGTLDTAFLIFRTNVTGKIKIIFNENCDIGNNYIELYYVNANDECYALSEYITSDFGNIEVVIPAEANGVFYFALLMGADYTDWGWKIDSIEGTSDNASSYYRSSLPDPTIYSREWSEAEKSYSYGWHESTLETYTELSADEVVSENMTHDNIFKLLTNDGQIQGLFQLNGQIYVNASYIGTGTISIGGHAYSDNPTLLIKDNTDHEIGKWTKNGIEATKGTFGDLIIDSTDSTLYLEGIPLVATTYLSVTSAENIDTAYIYINPSIFEDDIQLKVIADVTATATSGRIATMSLYKISESGARTSVETGVAVNFNSVTPVSNVFNTALDHTYEGTYQILINASRDWLNQDFSASIEIGSVSEIKTLRLGGDAIYAPTIKGNFWGSANLDSFACQGWFIDRIRSGGIVSDPALQFEKSDDKYLRLRYNRLQMADVTSGHTRGISISTSAITRTDNGNSYTVSWVSSSDKRVKENIEDISSELSIKLIDATKPKKFKYIEADGYHYGMIAQDVRKTLDSLGEKDVLLEHQMPIPDDMKSIDNQRMLEYTEYIPHLINYVKELRAELTELKAELNKLKEG